MIGLPKRQGRNPMHRFARSALVTLSTAILAACTSGGTTNPVASPSTAPSVASNPAASGPTTVATGMFHRVDADATGSVALEHLADGSLAVELEKQNTSLGSLPSSSGPTPECSGRRPDDLANLDQMAVRIADVGSDLASVILRHGEELDTLRRPVPIHLLDVGDPDIEERT